MRQRPARLTRFWKGKPPWKNYKPVEVYQASEWNYFNIVIGSKI